MAPNSEMFIQECLGPGIPFSRIIDLDTKKDVCKLDNNDKLGKTLRKFARPKIKELTIDLPSSVLPATVRLFLPSGYRVEEDYAFPLVIDM